MPYSKYSAKQKKLAAVASPRNKITGADFKVMKKKRKRKNNMKKNYHKTKDGRTVKKGLYYYMNKRKKAGTSRKGKGTVSSKALKRSAKTARS
jgi:hypothetical protein